MKSLIKNYKYGQLSPLPYETNQYRAFETPNDAESWGAEHYGDWAKKYHMAQSNANAILNEMPPVICPIEHYCGYTYRQINNVLRFLLSGSNNYAPLAHSLLMSLTMAPRIPHSIVAYRMVSEKFIDNMIENNKKGWPITERGFLSTSLLHSIMQSTEPYSGQDNCLKIYIPAGTVGVYVNTVTWRPEQEVLIAPNRILRMVRYPYKHPVYGKSVFECELINGE